MNVPAKLEVRSFTERGRQTSVGCMVENMVFSSFMRQYLENGKRYVKSYYGPLLMSNRKLHMRFRLALRSITLDDLKQL